MEGSMFGGKNEQFDEDDDEADRIRGGRTIVLVPLIRATATIRRRATTTTTTTTSTSTHVRCPTTSRWRRTE